MFSLRNNCKLDILTSLSVIMTILAKHILHTWKTKKLLVKPHNLCRTNCTRALRKINILFIGQHPLKTSGFLLWMKIFPQICLFKEIHHKLENSLFLSWEYKIEITYLLQIHFIIFHSLHSNFHSWSISLYCGRR